MAIKAAVVAGDEREGSAAPEPDVLNYGHTLAHALEIAGAFDLRHGEAVAIGLVFAAELAAGARAHRRRRGWPSTAGWWPATGCPTGCPPGADPDQLVQLMGRDKKARRASPSCSTGPAGWSR